MKVDKFKLEENKRQLKRMQSTVDKVNALEDEMTKLSDEELKNKTTKFKNRNKNGKTLEDLTSEAYADVRKASIRVMNMKPFDVQIMGIVVMNEKIKKQNLKIDIKMVKHYKI